MSRVRAVFEVSRRFIHDVNDTNLSIFAGSLVYITLLSLVPTLALSFSVLHAFGVQNQLEPLLVEMLSPIGEQADQLVGGILAFVNNTNFEMLGVLGVCMILYSGVSMVLKLEFAFNHIWQVKETRPIIKRIGFYLAMLLLGPVMFFLSMASMGAISGIPFVQGLLSVQYFSTVYYFLINVLPFILIISALFVLYWVLPNYKVSPKFAAYSAIITAGVWKLLGLGFASFVATSVNYNVVYSSFAVVVLFIFWVYLTWLSILVGTMICAQWQYRQHPNLKGMTPSQIRLIRLLILLRIVKNSLMEDCSTSIADLAQKAQLPSTDILQLVSGLVENRLITFESQVGGGSACANLQVKDMTLGELLTVADFSPSTIDGSAAVMELMPELGMLQSWYLGKSNGNLTLSELCATPLR